MKICVIGAFGYKTCNGQTIKTGNVYRALAERFGDVEKIDTFGWKKNPIKLFFRCRKAVKDCDNIVFLPAHNGVKVFVPLLLFFNRKSKKKLHYVAIGGWLPELAKKNKRLAGKLKQLNGIYVETESMKDALKNLDIDNVYVMPNFKYYNRDFNCEKTRDGDIIRLCIFSRIVKEKGIEEAVDAVNHLNALYNNTCFLDIYGQIDNNYLEKFNELRERFNENISYKGIIESDEAIKVISNYDLLLFPTKFYTEGIPGTILDAFFAGVPVLASRWMSATDIIQENENGLLFEFNNHQDFIDKLAFLYKNREILYRMKEGCKKTSERYKPEVAVSILVDNF